MAGCCFLTRRQLLQWAALVAATPLLSSLTDQERAYGLTGAAQTAVASPVNLELVTLTETSVILTWFTGDPTRPDQMGRLAPVPADTEVLLGTSPADLHQAYHDPTPTPYHYVELAGLEPGQTYFYMARSGGLPAAPAPSSQGNPVGTSTVVGSPSPPFLFSTPQPPPGRFLFAVALCNDLHLGETVAGLATTQAGIGIPPGIMQVPGQPPYPEVMATALGSEARARGANLLLAAGDLSSEAGQADVNHAKAYLDAFGTYGETYLVARGNHDRPHTGSDAAACTAVPAAPGYHDCFRDAFFSAGPSWFARQFGGMRVLGLDTYDKIGNGGDNGVLSDAQFAFVRDELARDPDRPTLVFGHHPVSLESSITTVGKPLGFDLDTQQAMQLESLYAKAPGVFLHHAGHTHRNKRTLSPTLPSVVFQEVGAVKEYPGGFHLLRVHTGGYALNFYKFRDRLALEWSERSRPEYGGLSPFYVFGNVADRNSVVARDLSGLSAAATVSQGSANGGAPAAAAARAAGGSRGGVLPETGLARGPVVGEAALAAAAAATTWLRRQVGTDSGH
jgi:Icc protein